MKLQTKGPIPWIAVALMTCSFSALADPGIKIQNAQFNSGQGHVFVKGKLSEVNVSSVQVYDATSRLSLIGELDVKGNQFRGNFDVSGVVPCTVMVRAQEGRSSRNRSRRGGVFSISDVTNAGDHCD